MEKKINITSSAIEKGLDLAKDFLDKLIIPTVEETGLLLKDRVTLWRFNNQVKMLIKAKETCEKYNIKLKTVSLKLLCPLLDYAGLEENEILQDKWANLLTNLVDSEQNIENHVFPYLLSQVSLDEFMFLETVYRMKVEEKSKLEMELEYFLKNRSNIEKDLKEQIAKIESELQYDREKKRFNNLYWEAQRKKWEKESELRVLDFREHSIQKNIKEPAHIPIGELKKYEVSNLIRLGVAKSIPRQNAYVREHKIKNEPDSEYLSLQDMDIIIDSEEDDLILTELGELFISACNEKK